MTFNSFDFNFSSFFFPPQCTQQDLFLPMFPFFLLSFIGLIVTTTAPFLCLFYFSATQTDPATGFMIFICLCCLGGKLHNFAFCQTQLRFKSFTRCSLWNEHFACQLMALEFAVKLLFTFSFNYNYSFQLLHLDRSIFVVQIHSGGTFQQASNTNFITGHLNDHP